MSHILDVLMVVVFDPERRLVAAAKELVHLFRTRCSKCDVCDAQIRAARERCREWRRLQAVKRETDWSVVLVAMVSR